MAMLARALLVLSACWLAAGAAQLEAGAVRDVLSRVLRLRPPPPPPAAAAPAAPARPPPRHMLELYRKYAAGAARRPHHGNTVRSILPDPELSSLDSMLVFNVSLVAAAFSAGGEDVRAAQLLLHGGRCWPPDHHHQHHHNHNHQQEQPALPPLALAPPCRARLYRLHTAEPGGSRRRRRPMSLLSTLPLAPARGGWTSLEVSAPLRELLLGQGRALAVRFEAPGGRALPPRAFLQPATDHRHAFLVVFSDDVDDRHRADDGADGDGQRGGRQPAEAAADDFRPRHTHDVVEMLQAAGADVFQSPSNASSSSSVGDQATPPVGTAWSRHTRHRLMLESNALEPQPQTHTQHWRHHGSRLLVKRSIEDNELPESEAEEGEAALSRLSPDLLLHARGAAGHHGRDNTDGGSDVIPLPGGGHGHGGGKRVRGGGGGGGGGGKRRRGRGRKHGRRARKRTQQQEADWAENAAGSEVTALAGNSSATCRRHRMAVNFADIGWADWIIAPEAFDAYFCAGRCPFPLPNKLKRRQHRRRGACSSLGWTNHAFLQSLVRSLGQEEVPAPCCAPSALSDLTLLYNDHSVVVLRRFPKMSVLSCSCQ